LLIAVMALAAVLSAFITPNGAAAALLPVTVVVARRASLLPSKMLIRWRSRPARVRYSR
jgi:Na+/H+ antiporter NhaD/arsenite permease-like protein